MRLTNKPQKLPIHTQILIHNMNNFSDATGWQFFFKAKLLLLKLIFRQRWVWIYRICLSLLVQVTLKKKENNLLMWNHCFHNEICITLCFHLVLRGRVGGWSVAESERKKGGWSLGVLRGGPSAAKQVTVLDGPHVTLILLCVYVYKPPDQDRVWLHSLPTHTHRPDKAKSQS